MATVEAEGVAHSITEADAARNFASLMTRVTAGEEVTITRDGKAIARLRPATRPVGDAAVREANRAALEAAFKLREELRAEGVRVTQAEVKEWINEGRR